MTLRGALPPPNMLVKALPMPGQQPSQFGVPPSVYNKLCDDAFLCAVYNAQLTCPETAAAGEEPSRDALTSACVL